MTTELADVHTADLLEELRRRFDLLYFYGLRQNLETLNGAEEVFRVSQGDATRLVGMIEREKFALLHGMLDDAVEGDEEP